MGFGSVPADREVSAALSSGDPAAPAQVYDLYAYGLYAYACGFVDASTASDVVHDSVWIAARRIDALRDPDLLRAWLYAIARSECARRTRIDFVPAADPASPVDPDVYAVRDAVGRLGATEREVVELSVRHSFHAHEIDAILGSAVGDGRVFAHAQDAVGTSVPDVPNAIGLFALLPLVPLPPRLRDRVLTAVPLDTELADMGRRIDPLNRNGFPMPRRGRRTAVTAAASVVGILALTVVALVSLPDSAPAELPAPRPNAERLVDPGPATTTTAATTSAYTTTSASTTTTEPTVEPTTQAVDVAPTTTAQATTSPAAAPSTASESTRFPRRTTERVDDAPAEIPDQGGGTTTRTPQPTTTREPTTRPDFPSFPSIPTRGNG